MLVRRGWSIVYYSVRGTSAQRIRTLGLESYVYWTRIDQSDSPDPSVNQSSTTGARPVHLNDHAKKGPNVKLELPAIPGEKCPTSEEKTSLAGPKFRRVPLLPTPNENDQTYEELTSPQKILACSLRPSPNGGRVSPCQSSLNLFSMVVEGSGMAEVPLKTTLPRKSAFSCEACRKRKLESRVAQLEDALSKLRGQQGEGEVRKVSSPASVAESSSSAGRRIKSEPDDTLDLTRDFDGLNVENDGRISFHGPTSLFQLPSGMSNETASSSHFAQELEARKERLITSAWRERAFEQMAAMPEPFQYLLDSHWCWIQPLFNFVYRPAFTRDMKIHGPYYSDVLLNAVLSHSVRWCKAEPQVGPLLDSFEGGAQFYQRAVSGLFDSLKVGYATVPTIQTLLLLSAQECGRGNRTQAWLYSGMAFRVLDDLGISIDSRKFPGAAQLSDEDVEIRNRLFWSCYFWDKVVSLYFGRAPTMQHSRVSPPLDDTSEIEIWTPHGVSFPDGAHYPPTQARSTSCFIQMCGLAEILNQILIHIYDPVRRSTETEFFDCVQEQAKNLSDWWDGLPDYLKLVATDLPSYSPPSHITTLNCLYHTINILLHRPILCSRGVLKTRQEAPDTSHLFQCMASATTILSLFDLYCRTFGDSHVVLSLAYSIYTAASIFLLEIQALKYAAPGTLDKLKFCIFALERVKISNPVITTALNLVYQELQKLQIDIHAMPAPPLDSEKQSHQHPPQPSHPGQQSQSPPLSNNPSRHVSPGQQHRRQHSRIATATQPGPTGPNTTDSMMPGYSAFPPQSVASFDLSQIGDMPQMPPTHLLGGMPNAVMAVDDPGSYEITPEVFEAFSYAQPISANMTSPFETNWAGQGQ
ncbi:hypothetical protein N7462_005930 [Penicillium macrosclerotiorum]|uniref:uncharacterized protein n=1 Tax=Penicillium macrosclerotiorum TaxID=303699 RepID=UPI00254819C2|nr:uncharacterized protein N7462_005930 [Penicillium macrosclerotiorum]KAJ5682765.1 hypothetical protein N7462_005930 [Penicillium macrosclerotiorum]